MPKVHRRITGKGFTEDTTHKFIDGSQDAQITSANTIKGVFGRKRIIIEWENEDTGEVYYIPVHVLRPGELRLLRVQVFTEPGAKMLDDIEGVPTDEEAEQLRTAMNLNTHAEMFLKIREFNVEVVYAGLDDEELKDREWLMNEASDAFLENLRQVIMGVPAVAKEEEGQDTVSNFPEVDLPEGERD